MLTGVRSARQAYSMKKARRSFTDQPDHLNNPLIPDLLWIAALNCSMRLADLPENAIIPFTLTFSKNEALKEISQ
jgi:hypothetical protein